MALTFHQPPCIINTGRFLLWKKNGKILDGYEGYQVSNLGKVRTYNKITFTKRHGARHWKNRILKFKPYTTTNQRSKQGMGYRVTLWKNGKPKTLLVARLVATTFLEDLIDTNMTVNHKNGNRLDNRVENLEWLSMADNIKYGFENGQYKQQAIILYNEKENLKFRSLSQASLFLKRNPSYINNCIKNSRKITSFEGTIYEYKLI